MKSERNGSTTRVVKGAARREVIVANLVKDSVSLGREISEQQQTENLLLQMNLERESIQRQLPSFMKRKPRLDSGLEEKTNTERERRGVNRKRPEEWPRVSQGFLLREKLKELMQWSRDLQAEIVTRHRRIRRLQAALDMGKRELLTI